MSVASILDRATSALAELAAVPLASLPDEELCAAVRAAEAAGRLLDGSRVAAAAEIEERSRFDLGSAGLAFRLGLRRGVHLVEQLTLISQPEAARRIQLGTALRDGAGLTGERLPATFPLVAASMQAGATGVDSAQVIVRCLAQALRGGADPVHVGAAESALVAAAACEPADSVAVMARAWREALDPDGAEPREEALRQRRGFRLGREREGMTQFSGACDPVSAALLRSVLSESTAPDVAPRFLDDLDAEVSTEVTDAGEVVTRVRDRRSREQRQLDVVVGLLTAGVRSTGRGPVAAVTAVIRLDDLVAGTGVGWIDDVAEPVSAETIRELACDAGYRRLVLGLHGEILDFGRTERYFTPTQRRALAARDGGCVWPQCSAPPSWCHAHHVEEWALGGATDIGNGALLCPAHHHMLHASAFSMTMIKGRPHLLAPPGLDPGGEWRRVGGTRLEVPGVRRAA